MEFSATRCVAVGVMSGTSLDGVDLCSVQFTASESTDDVEYEIISAAYIPYTEEWKTRLANAHALSGAALIKLHTEYGHLMGEIIGGFVANVDIAVDFAACHGHTVFHQPESNFTFQLGDSETIASHLKCRLVSNFRSRDVALGGQGAPLVPFGERFLFSKYDFCLNLGGIANISVKNGGVGFDICPCNMLLNNLARLFDDSLEFDRDGAIARRGKSIQDLLEAWNGLSYYGLDPPKSLGREWFEEFVIPYLTATTHDAVDILHTAVGHIAEQIVKVLQREVTRDGRKGQFTLLTTGGGTLNCYLIEVINDKLQACDINVTIDTPGRQLIEFKEALVFAFLGWRTLQGRVNVTNTVTGSRQSSVSGSIHQPTL